MRTLDLFSRKSLAQRNVAPKLLAAELIMVGMVSRLHQRHQKTAAYVVNPEHSGILKATPLLIGNLSVRHSNINVWHQR